MVQQLNDMHGENFHVYETIAPTGPHAVTGGCIMYNRTELQSLVQRWMGISDPDTVRPMLYAALAHEFGPLEHGDVDEPAVSRAQAREHELNADRFAGYTLSRLGIARLDPDQLTFYYRLLGDDFAGAGPAGYHGSSEERSAALQDGWHRGELGLPEAGGEPAAGLGHP